MTARLILFSIILIYLADILNSEIIEIPVERKNVTLGTFTYEKAFLKKENHAEFQFKIGTNNYTIKYRGEPIQLHKGFGNPHYTIEEEKGETFLKIIIRNSERYTGDWSVLLEGGKEVTNTILPQEDIIEMNYAVNRYSRGDEVSINCQSSELIGSKSLSWEFSKDGSDFQKYPSANGPDLLIANATEEHAGYYLCKSDNDQVSYLLKLKNSFAVYWPLIGIAVEILILVITIVIYEAHQSKKRKARNYEDEKMNNENNSHTNIKDSSHNSAKPTPVRV